MLTAGRTTSAMLAAFLMVFLIPVSFLAEAGNGGKVSADQKSASCNTYPVAPLPPMHYGRFLLDRMEYTLTGQEDKTVSYEATGWYGGDYQRLWLELEGTHDTGSADGGEVERLDILHGRLVSPFWNIRAGMGYRGTIGPDSDERFFAVFGLKGIAPYGFEIDTNFRISNRGEVLLDLEAEYDVYLAQRIVLQPRLDASFSFNRMEGLGIGPGFPGLDLSARLRYEIRREIAPYIGIRWSTMTGGSRDISRQEEEPRDVTSFIAGLRLWF